MINCRSIKNKVDEFSALMDSIKPTITLGTEPWLNDDIADNEMFPGNYACYRKDRNSKGGGIEKNVSSFQLPVQVSECEDVFFQITLSNKYALTVSSFYRPPDSSVDILRQFKSAVETIQADNLVIGGDFNLPNAIWIIQVR